MAITDALEELYSDMEEVGIDPRDFGIYDTEDLEERAIRFLASNLEDAFPEIDEL